MTRSASPNGQVEFSYDFPVASTSQLPPTPKHTRTHTTHTQPRTRSPTRPRWESSHYYADDDDELFEDGEIDYDAFGYPTSSRQRRAQTHPAPTPTRNQWRSPSPPLYPYAPYATSAYPSQYSTTSAYPYSAPLLLAPPAPHHPISSSCESACSMLSACSRASKEKEGKAHHVHAKIRKPRRSVDSDSPPSLVAPSASSPYTSPASSPASSPYFSTYGDDFDEEEDRDSHHSADDEEEEEKEEEEKHGHSPSSFRRQWAALSLRVRFGVFRAKRKMRNRVMSL